MSPTAARAPAAPMTGPAPSGYVGRSSGAGCGDHWPLCNGVVIPREASVATLIEYSHRLTSGLALVFVLALLACIALLPAWAGEVAFTEVRYSGDEAFYMPGTNNITMPHREAFTSPEALAATLRPPTTSGPLRTRRAPAGLEAGR